MRPAALRCLIATALSAAAAVLAADPASYTKQPTWQETLRLSREALVQVEEAAAAKAAAEQPQQPATLALTPWHQVGPFTPPGGKKVFDFAFPPEEETALMTAGSSTEAIGGALRNAYGKLRWVPKPDYRDGVPRGLSAGTHASTYLYRTITVTEPKAITCYFGSDDGMRAWLNGEVIISHDVPRGYGPNQEKAELALKPGTNHLLLKIHNNSGGHGFYFHTDAKPVSGGNTPDPKQVARKTIWDTTARDFRAENGVARQMDWERQDNIWTQDWPAGDLTDLAKRYVQATRIPVLNRKATALAANVTTPDALHAVRRLYYQSRQTEDGANLVKGFDFEALRRAVEHLTRTFPEQYPGGDMMARLQRAEAAAAGLIEAMADGDAAAAERLAAMGNDLDALRYEALLTRNPLVDFDRLLLVKRGAGRLGLPQNWVTNASISKTGYDNEISVLSPVHPSGTLSRLHRPEKGAFVGDVDLHWDADRMLFSSIGPKGRWQVFEIKADGTGLHQVTPGREDDVDNFDACYLPDGNIIFSSTRCFHGVPCVGGGAPVANLCRLDVATGKERQLCFDQDQNWCPTVLNNGRVLYTRWEYSDTPHYFTRLLFHMNPDGTEQMEYAFSNSYWPNSTFYARPVPGTSTEVVAVVSGHHGVPRMGELIIYDPARGRHEADGAVQRIPGHDKPVPPTIADQLVNRSWPRFLHPYPLDSHFILVSCQPDPESPWGLYLVDTFDNMLPIMELPGYALFEPVPMRRTVTPPVIPGKVDLSRKDAVIYLNDVYTGPGLAGVPRGTVKSLRVYEFHFGYNGMGGHINVGIDGPWDVRRILGTVPVDADGSALFRVPANTPVAVQPLDAQGRALQVMRSWYTAMPGEFANCIGCHEPQNMTPSLQRTAAATREPSAITPWRGPPRGFSFKREVQPVLDKHCAGCHNGSPGPNGQPQPNFADTGKGMRGFTNSYLALHPYVRRPGPESDYHIQKPMEWFADTSELVQMLRKGHHGVSLDDEAWDRLTTWIDLNVPDHGTWAEHRGNIDRIAERRKAMRLAYAYRPEDPEAYPTEAPERPAFVPPRSIPIRKQPALTAENWPFDAAVAAKLRAAVKAPTTLRLDLGDGVSLDLALVPAGEFIMGSMAGYPDEGPPCNVSIDGAFYMGTLEVSNAQFRRFAPGHDSGVISVMNKDHSYRGRSVNGDSQPVVRVTWAEAMAFCAWLSNRTGHEVSLPTEAQWEWACRAGTSTPLSFGGIDTNFASLANLADQRLNDLCIRDSPKWIPAVMEVNDGATVTADVGTHDKANAWGLHDMHGNAAEWTLTTYRPYPYAADGRDNGKDEGRKVARGGSYYDRPKRARSAFRQDYETWQPVHNVGFRVVVPVDSVRRLAAVGQP